MQRTYGRRALRRRSGVDNHEHERLTPDPSPSRKRQKVFVEIISPKTKKPYSGGKHAPSTQKPGVSELKPTATQLDLSGSPKTPEKSFTPSSHLSRSGSQSMRGSVIKRMQGRSKTESSLEATPLAETPLATTSTAQIIRQASTHSLPTAFPEREPTPEASSQSSLPTRNVRTYAGSSRSFLVALPLPDADPLKAVEDDTEPHESYTDLRTRWGIDLSEDDPRPSQDEHISVPTPLRRNPSEQSQYSLPVGMMNDLKSITELRSKGESRRFLDEVGYLFEGLDSSSATSLRRAGALEVVSKLCDSDFNRRAKTSDFYVRTWDKFWAARAGTSDKIFDATIAFFAALAARDPHTLIEVAQQKEFVPTLVEILSSLDHRKDVLASVLASSSSDELKSHGMLQTEIAALKSLARLVSKESHLSSMNQPSARFFIAHSLALLPPSFLGDQHLPALLTSLRGELELLESRITAYESGLPLIPPTITNQSSIPSFCHIEACLRLLDSYLLEQWSSTDSSDGGPSSDLSYPDGFASELVSLCIAASSVSEGSEEEMEIARKCLCGALRVLTLLSHDDPWWCSAALDVSHALPFVTMTAMRSQVRWSTSRHTESRQRSTEAFDLLCLALGLVMNWATLNPDAAMLSRTKAINPACTGTRACVRSCRCPDQTFVLECFAMLHAQYSGQHPDDLSECAFLRGYTAILLGLLIRDDPSNQALVVSTLPGTTSSERIKSLITHCRSFLDLYNDNLPTPTAESSCTTTEEEANREKTGRRRATWDERGDAIARSVITSLETLCAYVT